MSRIPDDRDTGKTRIAPFIVVAAGSFALIFALGQWLGIGGEKVGIVVAIVGVFALLANKYALRR